MKFASFKSSALKSVGAVSLCVALGAGLVGCGGNGAGGGAVAATVNGQDIMEQTITDYVANFRTSSSLESDEAWASGWSPTATPPSPCAKRSSTTTSTRISTTRLPKSTT
ncbi:MAG: hypothetical protein ACLTDR_14270 [Adlercreutzia equolifaciens]